MRLIPAMFLSLAIVGCASHMESAEKTPKEQTPYNRIYKKPELPSGGKFVKDPKKKDVQYYFTNRMLMWKDKSNAQKLSGLYISKDNGKTWKLLCLAFEFMDLFIHPGTGVLYAAIDYRHLVEDEAGFLRQYHSNKALMSKDGKHWEDITGGHGHVADIVGFMVDPENPERICMKVCGLRLYVLQSNDPEYSIWNWYRAWDWPKRKELKTGMLRNPPVIKGNISVIDALDIKRLSFATILYSPNGNSHQGRMTVNVEDYHTLEFLLELLSYFPAKDGRYKKWPHSTPYWRICLHENNKKMIVLYIYNHLLKSPIDGSFSPSIDDPKSSKIMKLLNGIIESEKRQIIDYYQKNKQ